MFPATPQAGEAVPYEHTQPGHVIRISLLAAAVVMLVILLAAAESAPLPAQAALIAAMGLDLVAAWLFGSLTVTVDSEALEIRFGPGLIRKRWPLDSIVSCRPVRNSFLYGWGIHWTFGGWVFNVSGFGAVEVTLRSGRRFRIGSDEPAALAEAIRAAAGLTPAP